MFWNSETTKEKVYNFVDRLENFKDRMQILPVDFEKPWWEILLRQKKLMSLIILVQIVNSMVDSFFPIMIGYAVLKLDLNLFFGIVGLKLFTLLIYNLVFRYNAIFEIQTMSSIEYSANKFFLSVDPIFHTTKSSGQIISKINRGSSAFEPVLDIVVKDMLGILTGLITITITMFTFSLQLGLICLIFLILVLAFNITAQIYRTKIFQPKRIKSEDVYKSVSMETLIQAPFIRATFASGEQNKKLIKSLQNATTIQGNAWQSGTYVGFITRALHILSMLGIGSLVLIQAKNGTLEPVIALSILLAYINGTQPILYTGGQFNRLTTALANITDLFDFIRGFGKQTFPVLEEDLLQIRNK